MKAFFSLLVYLIFLSTLVGQLVRIGFGPRNSTAILFSDLLIVLIFCSWLVWKLIKKEKFVSFKFGFEIFLFFIVALISWLQGFWVLSDLGLNFYGRDMIIAFLYLGRLFLYFSLYYVFRDLFGGILKANNYFKTFVVIVFSLAVLGFVQLVVYPDFTLMAVKYGWDPHIGRLLSTWFDPNFLGSFLAFAVSILLSYFFISKNKKEKVSLFVVILTLLMAVFLTYSRTGYLALACSLFLFGLLYKRRILALLFVMLLFILMISPRAFDRVTGAASLDATAWKRIDSWTEALSLWSAYPVFGVGYNLLPKVQDELGTITEDDFNNRAGFENSLLTILATTGVVGLLAFSYLWLKILLYLWVIYQKRDLPSHLRAGALGLFIAIISLSASSMFIHSLFYPHIMIYLFYFIALLETEFEKIRYSALSTVAPPFCFSPFLQVEHHKLGEGGLGS